MKLPRPVVLGVFFGFLAGALLTSFLIWRFGNQFGFPLRSQSAAGETTSFSTNRWPLEESSDGVGLAHKAEARLPLKYSGPDRQSPPAKNASYRSSDEHIGSGQIQEMINELRKRRLTLPVRGIKAEDLRTSFNETRGERLHQAMDILAPRNTPVIAVEDGTIAKLYYSDKGGITIYEFDPDENYVYYYAHLERYANDLHQGDHIKRGQIIGYVGTSGNAPKDTPHLHFAIARLAPDKHWWEGTPIDPYLVLR
jgi:murein DD-endopeptidase MepM/ murein hydrolase activator NlpD